MVTSTIEAGRILSVVSTIFGPNKFDVLGGRSGPLPRPKRKAVNRGNVTVSDTVMENRKGLDERLREMVTHGEIEWNGRPTQIKPPSVVNTTGILMSDTISEERDL